MIDPWISVVGPNWRIHFNKVLLLCLAYRFQDSFSRCIRTLDNPFLFLWGRARHRVTNHQLNDDNSITNDNKLPGREMQVPRNRLHGSRALPSSGPVGKQSRLQLVHLRRALGKRRGYMRAIVGSAFCIRIMRDLLSYIMKVCQR